ncbi:hypothetical protein IJD44_00865 [bacterium]|nr:hypothetical protein [bacterium]
MREIQVSYTILDIINVPDDCSDDEIQETVEGHAMDLGIYQLVNDIEWNEVTYIQDVFGLVSKETYSKLLMDLSFEENEDEFEEESEE